MKTPNKEEIEDAAKKQADIGILFSAFPHHWLSVKYGFEKGAEWMEQQLEPLITELGMDRVRDAPQSADVMTLQECKTKILEKYNETRMVGLIPISTLIVLSDEAAELYSSQFKAKSDQLQAELEQVKAERDVYKEGLREISNYETGPDYLLKIAQQALQSTKQ